MLRPDVTTMSIPEMLEEFRDDQGDRCDDLYEEILRRFKDLGSEVERLTKMVTLYRAHVCPVPPGEEKGIRHRSWRPRPDQGGRQMASDNYESPMIVNLGKSLMDENDRLRAERNALKAEVEMLRTGIVAEVDNAIGDSGVPERDCSLPIGERVANIIRELKQWRHDYSTEAMENEKLRAEIMRLAGLLQIGHGAIMATVERLRAVVADAEPIVEALQDIAGGRQESGGVAAVNQRIPKENKNQ